MDDIFVVTSYYVRGDRKTFLHVVDKITQGTSFHVATFQSFDDTAYVAKVPQAIRLRFARLVQDEFDYMVNDARIDNKMYYVEVVENQA
jgi:hypothetical protein